ncbi:MAG TPA: sigma-70 family RNA polymerase sigma factor [Polyangia bacterium]
MSGHPPSRTVEELLVHAGWLNRLAFHLIRDRDQVADAVQEVWLAAHRSPPAGERPARPWLSEVLRNVVRMRVRRDGRRSRVEREASVLAAGLAGPGNEREAMQETAQERLHMQRLLLDSLMGLDESLRTTVLLRFFEEKTSTEIGRLLGIAPGTVRWRLKTAMDQLRTEIDQRAGGRQRWVAAFAGGGLSGRRDLAWGKAVMSKARVVWFGTGAVALVGLVTWWGLHAGPGDGIEARSGTIAAARELPRIEAPRGREPNEVGSINGRVVAPDGSPVEGASVFLVRNVAESLKDGATPAVEVVRSDARGEFDFPAVPPGEYVATAMAPGWAPGRSEATVTAATKVGVDIALGGGGLRLAGRVLDVGGGPIPHARVTAVLVRASHPRTQNLVLSAVADEQGRYALHSRAGIHDLRVEADGYAALAAWMNLTTTRTRDFELSPSAHLVGLVRERGSGRPVAGAEVTLVSSEERPPRVEIAPARSDEAGRFVFSAVTAGAYLASARKGPLVSASRDLVLSATDEAEIELIVDRGLTMSGHVRDHEGRAVAEARVRVSRLWYGGKSETESVSAADGSYLIEGLLPGVYYARAHVEAFSSMNRQAITMADQDREGVDLSLDRPAIIEGRVLRTDAQPAADIEVVGDVRDRRPDREMTMQMKAVTDVEGRFRIVVTPSKARLDAHERDGGSRAALDLGQLVAGEVRKVELRLSASGTASLAGTVIDRNGRPVADVAVLVESYPFSTSVRTNNSGRFVADRLDAGAYALVVRCDEDDTHRGPWNTRQTHVQLTSGEVRSDLVLTMPGVGEIAGLVLDDQGRPVSGATILASPEEAARIVGGASRRAATDEGGRFRFTNLPGVFHALTGVHEAHPNVVARGVMVGRTDVIVRFPRAEQLSGIAVDEAGRPVVDYLLRVTGPSGRLTRLIREPTGRFHVPRAVAGAHSLVALTSTGQRGKTDVTIVAGERQGQITLRLAPSIDLAMRVVDAETAAAVPGAKARLTTEMSEQSLMADREGRFTGPNLPRGDQVSLFVEAPGYRPGQPRIDVPLTAGDPVVIKLKRDATTQLRP